MLGTMAEISPGHPENGLAGDIYRFIDLRPDEAWFNIKTTEEASPEDLSQIKIPAHLKPHFSQFRYIFFPKDHRLVFVQSASPKDISHNMVAELFAKLLNDNELTLDFPQAEITIEQDRGQLEKIYNIPYLEKLTINIKRPNPDGEDDAGFLENLESQHISEETIEMKNARGQSIKPNEKTKKIIRVAVSNGSVAAYGKDEAGMPVRVNTVDAPITASYAFDPKAKLSFTDVFYREALRLLRTLIG